MESSLHGTSNFFTENLLFLVKIAIA